MAPVVVRVAALDGEAVDLEVDDEASVDDARALLEHVLGVPAAEQRLLLHGSILDGALRPFAEVAQDNTELQFVRVLPLRLPELMSGKPCDGVGLSWALRVAAQRDDPLLCLEIISHEKFLVDCPVEPLLLHFLVQGGLMEPMEELMLHPGFVETLLGALLEALRMAAKRGLILQCDVLLARLENANVPYHAPDDAQFKCQGDTCTVIQYDQGDATVFHHAASARIINRLVESPLFADGTALNTIDKRGCTCLHYATQEDACRAILSQPAFSAHNAQDVHGETALHCARTASVCAAILACPGFTALGARDARGRTALHRLVRNEAALLQLLERDVDVNVVDDYGRTALHCANTAGACRALLAHPAFTAANARDQKGESALAIAVRARRGEVAALTKEAEEYGEEPKGADGLEDMLLALHAYLGAPDNDAEPGCGPRVCELL